MSTTILAIETSCDETGVGIARLDGDGTVTLLADEVASSVDEHIRYGGVVPEVASRAHLEALEPAMRRALATAGLTKPDVVAATIGPTAATLVAAKAARTVWAGAAANSRSTWALLVKAMASISRACSRASSSATALAAGPSA